MISVTISKVRTREKGGGVEFLKEMENDTRKSFSKSKPHLELQEHRDLQP